MKKIIIYSAIFYIIITLTAPAAVLAAEVAAPAAPPTPVTNPNIVTPCPDGQFCLNVPIGELKSFAMNGSSNILGNYIQAWYGFLLGTIGILATVMVMWGGFKYLTSRGDKGQIDSAKTSIVSAITGLVLAFGTYTLLYLINPALVTITTPDLKPIQGGGNVNLTQQLGIGESTANAGIALNSGTNTYVNGTGGGPHGFGFGLVGLPAPGGPNIQPTTRQIEGVISAATQTNPTNDYRPGDVSGVHFNGNAIDYPVNPQTTQYFNSLIQNNKPVSTFTFNNQPGYVYNNINIGGTIYPTIKIIDERQYNNDFHIDTEPLK